MDDEYDVIICGTGLAECILSGLLSQEKKKVLHIDRNPFYGGEGASLNLTAMWKQFRPNEQPPKELGANRDWNIDLVPKFIMASGNLVKILLKTRVSKYLEWKPIDGTYVYQYKKGGLFSSAGGKIEKVPATDGEALKSDLMSLFEKRRCKNFFQYVQEFDPKNTKTFQGIDVYKQPFAELIKKFSLEDNTVDFIGHAVALYTDDSFIMRPAFETITKIQLYMDSMGRYGNSPFIYPIYGLGGIPEGFSRMCAIYGGTFMLNQDIDKVLFDEQGKVCGVQSGTQMAKTKMLICSPSYAIKCGLQQKTKKIGRVIRAICILNHPIEHTKNIPSIQIIIPQRQIGRKSDLYVMMISSVHQACKQGFYIAIVSGMVETNNPEEELKPAYELLGGICDKFIIIQDMYEGVQSNDNVFVTNSMDYTSHFESVTQGVIDLYKMITGQMIDLEHLPEDNDE